MSVYVISADLSIHRRDGKLSKSERITKSKGIYSTTVLLSGLCHYIQFFGRDRYLSAWAAGMKKLLNYHDDDLMARALLDGVGISRVHRGCAYYRKHSDTISSSAQLSRAHLESRVYFVKKLEMLLAEKQMLERYASIVAKFYASIASNALGLYNDIADTCLERAQLYDRKALISSGTRLHRFGARLLGWKRKEQLARFLAMLGIGSRARIVLVRRQKYYRRTANQNSS